MSRWTPPSPLELQLWYGGVLVAELPQVFSHQGTWFAPYELKITPREGLLHDRLLEYIAFSEEFFRRIAQGEEHDFGEFDRFGPLADTASWRVPRPDGGVMPMAGRMWFGEGQASWEHPEEVPSAEEAANKLWACIAQHVAAADSGDSVI